MFDEQPDGDTHGECAAEIQRLRAELATCKADRHQDFENFRQQVRQQMRVYRSGPKIAAITQDCGAYARALMVVGMFKDAAGAWHIQVEGAELASSRKQVAKS